MADFLYTDISVPDGIGMGSFSIAHFVWLALSLFLFLIVPGIYKKADSAKRRRMADIITILLLADEALKYAVTIPTGQWEWDFLPLHVCSLSVFAVLFHRLTDNQYIAEYLYAVAMPTAIMALLFPDWTALPVLNIMCFHSFSIHLMIALYPMMLLAGGFRPGAKRLFPVAAMFLIASVAAYFINNALGTGFFFMNGAGEGNPLTVIEGLIGPWYRLAFPVIALILWVPMYQIPYRMKRKSG